ncbi:MAG: glycoside hydrolase family 15 protein [Deltaproteobacteria bacterium]|nr:glycoside hydrolase family 15 protein [Deltaproteobacteria bacterium]
MDEQALPSGSPRRWGLKPTSVERRQARIEDHGLIGNMRSAALVTRDGSIDWLCLPDFDSDACFAALLGTAENGFWRIAPSAPPREIWRRYRRDTLILETDFIVDGGMLRLIDFMPPGQEHPQIVRTLECLSGGVQVRFELKPRFAFGRAVPRLSEEQDFTQAVAGPDALYLRAGSDARPPRFELDFTMTAGERRSFILTYGRSYEPPPGGVDPWQSERKTESYWTGWCAQIRPPPQYREEVVRSLITLKACTFAPTGGIVAAPTTSLPETPGGVRNWDYRFTWLRDSVLALSAFMVAGLEEEAKAFWHWSARAIAGEPSQTQIMYGIRGERRLSEAELDWFTGYGGARPVRIGNAAYEQFQLDVIGEVVDTVRFAASVLGPSIYDPQHTLRAALGIGEFLRTGWQKPDRGIWEMRGPERSFTASKVAAWRAVDGCIEVIERLDPKEPIGHLRKLRQEIVDEVCSKGYSEGLNTFTQFYGSTDVDASLLIIPITGFLPVHDSRVVGTVAAIERDLLQDGLVLRFRPVGDVDGLTGEEGTFLACSFWLADAYELMGRHDDAVRLFERVASLANDLGLLSEEYDPRGQRQLGNFPQAFSHFELVRSAYLVSTGSLTGRRTVH